MRAVVRIVVDDEQDAVSFDNVIAIVRHHLIRFGDSTGSAGCGAIALYVFVAGAVTARAGPV